MVLWALGIIFVVQVSGKDMIRNPKPNPLNPKPRSLDPQGLCAYSGHLKVSMEAVPEDLMTQDCAVSEQSRFRVLWVLRFRG